MPDAHRTHHCYTLDHSHSDAVASFRSRYGAPPEQVFEASRMLWVGPIPQAEEEPYQLQLTATQEQCHAR